MSHLESSKDYYEVLGVEADATRDEIDRQYKREAHKHHPDRGGSEERMKSLNEAYSVLKDVTRRRTYDEGRVTRVHDRPFVPVSSAPARDVGVLGYVLSASLCLIAGIFLLVLVRFQWMWFLWPLAILAILVTGFGVLMARSAMVAVNSSLPLSNRFRKHTRFQEVLFWSVVLVSIYGIYLLFTL